MRVNIIMPGFFAAVSDLVSHDAQRNAVRAPVPEGTEGLNLSAFDKGYAYGREHSGHTGKLAALARLVCFHAPIDIV